MSEEKVKHRFWYYLNPFLWIWAFISYVLTFVLILNHFFVLILACVIAILVVLFFYDRYALLTYDGSTASDFSDAIFSKAEKYNSPLARGDKYLTKELADYFESEKRHVEKEKIKAKKQQEELQQRVNMAMDDQPFWDRRDDVSRSFISKEVKRRVSEIEQKILKQQK